MPLQEAVIEWAEDKLAENGSFHKMTCLLHTIKHAIYPLALKTEEGLRHIERMINTAGHNDWLTCDQCLLVCPSNPPVPASPGT